MATKTNTSVTIRMPNKIKAEMMRIAAERRWSLTTVVQVAIEDWILKETGKSVAPAPHRRSAA